jgi:hypothetical protein
MQRSEAATSDRTTPLPAAIRHREARLGVVRSISPAGQSTSVLLLTLMVLGFAAYFQLGQDETRPSPFAMVIQHQLARHHLQQVWAGSGQTGKKSFRKCHYADKIHQLFKPASLEIIFQVKDTIKGCVWPTPTDTVRKDQRHPRAAGQYSGR